MGEPAAWERRLGGAETLRDVLFPRAEGKAGRWDHYGHSVMATLGHGHPLLERNCSSEAGTNNQRGLIAPFYREANRGSERITCSESPS